MRRFRVFRGDFRPYLGVVIKYAAVWLLLAIAFPASAQWVTQTIKLVPGFNPVYLQVTPPNQDCTSVFGAVPGIQHVWMYNRYLQTSTFTTNPQDATHSQDHWLMWFPATSAKGFLSTLSQVRGGQCYLVNLATNAAPVTISITGVPAAPRIDWIPNDLVLAGFPIAESGKVTFFQFLKDTPEVSTTAGSGSGIYSINPLSARETQVRNPELTTITPGKAYWVRLGVFSDNPYPVQVTAPGENNSLQFLQDQNTTTLTLINSIDTPSTPAQVLHLKLIDSEAAPSGKPTKAGRAVVAALVPAADGSLSPRLLSDGLDLTLRSGEKRLLQVGLATALLATTTSTDATYQAFIEVTETTHGFRQLIPVVAEVPGSKLFARRGSLMGKDVGLKAA
ncbi:MAG: hypothetical protein JWM04_1777, partial [Verrucomicrobiales bacterium]|nr:hypothetical protein [Verrucomicrobiales bacterium]